MRAWRVPRMDGVLVVSNWNVRGFQSVEFPTVCCLLGSGLVAGNTAQVAQNPDREDGS